MTKKGKLVKELEEIGDVIYKTGADDLEIVNVATLKKQIYLIAEAVDKLIETEETRIKIAEWLERKEKGKGQK